MRIPFIGGAYAGRSGAIDTQALINYYVEGDPLDTRTPKYVVPTPGLTLIGQIAAAQGRCLYQFAGSLYAVVGNTVYKITGTSPLTTTTIGTLATSTGLVNIVDNGPNNGMQMLAVDSVGNGYVISASGSNSITAATWTRDGGSTPFTITGATDSFSLGSGHYGQMLFTTSAATGVAAGTWITVTGMSPTGYNGTWQIASILDSTHFYAGFTKTNLPNSTAGGTGTIVSGTLNYTTALAPSFSAGATVTITGCTPSGYNITNALVATTGANNFTVANYYPNPGIFVSGGSVSGATGVTQLTNAINGWPVNGVGNITFQDGYGIASVLNTNQFVWSALYNFSSWPGLNFNSKAAFSDNMNSPMSDGTKLYLFGSNSLEVWYDAGLQTQVWARIPAAVYKKGCVAADSPAIIDNSVVWLGQSYYGKVQIYQMRGASPPVRISTPQIEWTIGQYGTISDAQAFVYQTEGHEFYVLTFPTANATWVWDTYTKEWHQRSSSGGFWLPISYAYLNDTHFVLDNSGNLYRIDSANNTENGTAITRTITSPHFYGLNDYLMLGRAEVITNNAIGQGPSSGTMTLSWSKDYSNSFPDAPNVTWTFTGSPTQRFYFNRLGRARDWVFQLTTTQNPIIMDLMVHAANPEEEAQAAASKAH